MSGLAAVLGPLIWLAAMVLVGLLAMRWGADTRPRADQPPEVWIRHRC